jgi:hypothetical protein
MMQHAPKTAILLLVSALAACSENTMAPRIESSAPINVSGGGSTASLTPADTLRFSITIDPKVGATYNLGNGHTVYFPIQSICDPTTSSYGPGQWDAKCDKLMKPITVSVTAWVDSSGHPYEDFSPSIRFMPAKDPSGYVILSLTDPSAALNPVMSILYCPSPTTTCYDEAQTDQTLVTQHDPVSGKVWRRIKHFSGYNVAAGDDDPIDPIDVSALRRHRSGYILSSGHE